MNQRDCWITGIEQTGIGGYCTEEKIVWVTAVASKITTKPATTKYIVQYYTAQRHIRLSKNMLYHCTLTHFGKQNTQFSTVLKNLPRK